MYFFFFSSRRRHTRYWRDWSSDVCSSDLDVADQAAHRLGVGDLERVEALAHQRAKRCLVHALGQVAVAELDLEVELGGVGGPALAELLELAERLLELLAIGADDIEDQRVVDLPRE